MRLEFTLQRITDFKAFVGTHDFRWDIPGLTLIQGENQDDPDLTSNGASKSTIFDAWSWCLFGRTCRGLRNPDIAPWSRRSATSGVTVQVRIDEDLHIIQRTANPNTLRWDDKDIDQDKLEQKLGLTWDLAMNTLLLPQDRPLYFDRTPAEKMDLFATTLNLARWDERAALADEKRVAAQINATTFTNRQLSLQGTLEELDRNVAQAKADAEVWAGKARVGKREQASRIRALELDLEANEKILGEANLRADGAGTEIKQLKRDIELVQTSLRKEYGNLVHAKTRLDEAKSQKHICEEALGELRSTKTCPTCGQPVKPANLAEHKDELERALQQHRGVIRAGAWEKLNKVVTGLEGRFEEAQATLGRFEVAEDAARATVERVTPEVARLRAEIKEARKVVWELGDNPHTPRLKELQDRRKAIEGNLKALEASLDMEERLIENYKLWAKGFKEIKLQLVDEILGELEIVTNGLLEDVGLVGWKVRYDIERETKSGTIKRALDVEISSPKSSGYVKWDAWSGGERQRLKLVGALALSEVLLAKAGVEANIEVLDEPATYWSSEGVQDLCAFLSDRARQTKRGIYYIEHQAAESAHFSTILTVIKDKKGAYIVNG